MRVFLPTMPPAMVSGMVMSAQMARMITMVPKGSAAVDCTAQTTSHHCKFPGKSAGMVMSAQMARMITMVPKGSAAIDCTVF